MRIIEAQFGFFSALYKYFVSNQLEIPAWIDAESCVQLDFLYHTHSGAKYVSPLVAVMVDSDGVLSEANAIKIAGMFWKIFGLSITKQYETLFFEYNPIENYSMTESGTDSDSGTDTTTKTGTETTMNMGKTKTERENTRGLYGYDSTAPVNADKTNDTLTQTVGVDNSPMTETRTPNLTDETERESTHSHTLTRSGNIGVTTSQQMLQSERDLWKWNFYNDFLFLCADKVLTLPIY